MRNMVAFAASPECNVKANTSSCYIGLARRDEANNWAFADDRERNARESNKWRSARSFFDRAQAWARERAQRADAIRSAYSLPSAPAPAPAPMPTVLPGDALSEWSARPAQPPVEDVRFAKLHVNLGPLGIGKKEPDPNEKLPLRFAKLHVNLGPLGIGKKEPDPNEKLPLVDREIEDIPPSVARPPSAQRQTTLDGAPLQDYVAPDHSAGEQWPGPQRPTQQQTLDAFVAPPAPPAPPALEPDEEEWELTRAAPGEVFDTDRPHSPPRPAPPAPAPAPAPPRRLPAGCIMLGREIAEEFFEQEEREDREREERQEKKRQELKEREEREAKERKEREEREAERKLLKKRKRDPDADVARGIDDDWCVAGMGRAVLRDFATAKARALAGKLSFNANSVAIFWKRGDYTTMVKRRTRGGSAGHTDAYTVLSPALKRSTQDAAAIGAGDSALLQCATRAEGRAARGGSVKCPCFLLSTKQCVCAC